MSWRRLRVVLDHLPRESAFVTAIRDGMSPEDWQRLDKASGPVRYGPWSQMEMILADLRDNVARLVWMESDRSAPPPDPYPRPGVDLANVRGITPDVEAQLAYLREVERLHGAHPTDWPKEAT
jgi:hypothetical protein